MYFIHLIFSILEIQVQMSHNDFFCFDLNLIMFKISLQQFLSEEVGDEAFTFEDLNITPSNMNSTALTVLRRHRDYYHHDEIMDEDKDYCPPVSTYLSS